MSPDGKRLGRRGVPRYAIREYVGVLFVLALLALSGGDWTWREAWVATALYFGWVTATVLAVDRSWAR